MGTMNRFTLMLAAALVAASIPRATFASPDPSSVRTAGKNPSSPVEEAGRNVAKSAREAASIAKDVVQGAAKNTRRAVQDGDAAGKRADHAKKQKREAPATTPPSP